MEWAQPFSSWLLIIYGQVRRGEMLSYSIETGRIMKAEGGQTDSISVGISWRSSVDTDKKADRFLFL